MTMFLMTNITLLCFSGPADGFKWCWTNVYGPNRVDEREQFFAKLNALTSFLDLPWCIGGDFNVIRSHSESSVNLKISPCMCMFNSFICNHELLDIPLIGLTSTGVKFGSSPFRLELNWLLDVNFIKLAEDFLQNTKIEGWVGHQFITKLKMLKNEICIWKKESWGNL
ncbi:hypothetical protein AMTRI_Chr02g261150 [Amborella trichopoda]